jgi:hypothetical protein
MKCVKYIQRTGIECTDKSDKSIKDAPFEIYDIDPDTVEQGFNDNSPEIYIPVINNSHIIEHIHNIWNYVITNISMEDEVVRVLATKLNKECISLINRTIRNV